jgi:1-acyl-sn-glycerol-3-phosphate acyltransferase
MGLYTSRHPIARIGVVTRMFMALVRFYCRLRVAGVENIPRVGAFMLAANHSSHVDTAAIFAALPAELRRRVVAAAAKDYFFDDGPRQLFARIMFNVIPVSRSISTSSDPLRHVVRALREGYGVLLFPEGTRSQNGQLGPFRSGIGRLAAEFPDIPIVPVWLDGTARVLPKKAAIPIPRPATVSVRFGTPVAQTPARLGDKSSWRAVANEVREAVILLGSDSR